MKLRSPIAAALLAALSTFAQSAQAGPFEIGRAAYEHRDYAVALKLWQPLAESGQADAQNGLGVLYFKGWGVPKDTAKGMDLVRRAADQGYAKAQGNLAIFFFDGVDDSEPDYAEALHFAELAAAQSDPRGQYVLGRLHHSGRGGVAFDDAKAFLEFSAAAVQAYGPAQALLGELYDTGSGVPKDNARAYAWYNTALRNTDLESWHAALKERIDRLVTRATPDEINRGQAFANRCVESHYLNCGLK